MNRGDIVDTFGVSVNQSSTDINRYIGLAPDNLAYDKSAITYVRAQTFSPIFLKPNASGYLSQLRSLADGVIEMTDAWVGVLPDFDATPTPVRGVNPATLREVISAIRHKEAIKAKYQSLSQPAQVGKVAHRVAPVRECGRLENSDPPDRVSYRRQRDCFHHDDRVERARMSLG